jgi:hypothetical protein
MTVVGERVNECECATRVVDVLFHEEHPRWHLHGSVLRWNA